MLFMKWSSGFYHFPQVFIFTCKNSSVKTHAGIEFVLNPYLLVVKKNNQKTSFGQSFECDYKIRCPKSQQDDRLIVYCFMSCSEFLHSIEASTLTGNGCSVFVHWGNLYRAAPGGGSEIPLIITWPVLRFPRGSNEKPGKRQIFWTKQDYITLQ